MRKPFPHGSVTVDKSLLGIFGAGEAQLLVEIPRWAGVTEAPELPTKPWWRDSTDETWLGPYQDLPDGSIKADPMSRKFMQ